MYDDMPISADPIVKEAKKRFIRCVAVESVARNLFLEDIKFVNGDSDNGYQWPTTVKRNRDVDERPCLTINKARQHCLQIINDNKQNKSSISIRAVGDGASYESAQVYEGIVRHIEYQSNASVVYDTASKFQVWGGIGYWRVVTKYADHDSMDQEIYFEPINDPLSVYLDPDITELDGSDARFGFIYTDMPKEEFKEEYPEHADAAADAPLGNTDNWLQEDYTRIVEYFRIVEDDDMIFVMTAPDGSESTVRKSVLPEATAKAIAKDKTIRSRSTKKRTVEWFKIAGTTIIDRGIWIGKYIPIVRVVGEETKIDGLLDRKGHVRNLKDPQRMYNYWTSAAVEHVALQSKTPYIAPAQAIEGYETYWESANTVNHSILTFNHRDDNGEIIPVPKRQEPPAMAPAYLEGMKVTAQELMYVSGQHDASMGMQGNERSGKAINARQRQGENATYHFIDNLAIAIRFTGKILLDLIPKIYDTKRVMMIMAVDGSSMEVEIDPTAKKAHDAKVNHLGETIKQIFNPQVGRYDVEADIGPAYATRRQQAFDAFTQIITQAPDLTHVVGDILMRAGDFPMADEAAERLKRMVPPQALGQGPSLQLQEAQAVIAKLQEAVKELTQKAMIDEVKLKGKDQQKDIDVYEAETKRIVALQSAFDPQSLGPIIHQLVGEALQTHLQPVLAASAPALAQDAQPQAPGPGQAPGPAPGPGPDQASAAQVPGPQSGPPPGVPPQSQPNGGPQ